MRITSKGQVTIPMNIRLKMGFMPDTDVDFVVQGKSVLIVKSTDPDKSRGKKIIERIRGKATVGMSTADIMALTRGEGDE